MSYISEWSQVNMHYFTSSQLFLLWRKAWLFSFHLRTVRWNTFVFVNEEGIHEKFKGQLSMSSRERFWVCFPVKLVVCMCIYVFLSFFFAVQYVQMRNCFCISAVCDYNNWCWICMSFLLAFICDSIWQIQVCLLCFPWKSDNIEPTKLQKWY